MEAEEIPPCPYYSRGHCRGISTRQCKLSHTALTCLEEKCPKAPTCMLRHPSPCNLYFRSIRGCHRQNCNYRHLPIQENNTVLIARDDNQKSDELHAMIAAQQIQMSELHERLAAQEIKTKELLNYINKLGCKQGNNEASFKRLLEMQDDKLSACFGLLESKVERIKETKLKPSELTDLETKMQKMVDEKLKEQNNLHRSDLTEMDAKLDAQVTELKAIDEKLEAEKVNRPFYLHVVDERLKEQNNLHRSDLTKMDAKLDAHVTELKTIDVKLEEHKNLVRSELDRVDKKQKRYREDWIPMMDVKENDWQMGYTDYLRKALRDFAGNSFLHPHTCESLAKILDRLYNNLLDQLEGMDPS